jgi:hypothetical protein
MAAVSGTSQRTSFATPVLISLVCTIDFITFVMFYRGIVTNASRVIEQSADARRVARSG